MDEGHKLVGGMNPGAGVIRIGQTVRRPAGSSSPAVRALLLHLEEVGFEHAPRFLGIDDEGRDVLTFVEGEVPLPPYPSWALSDIALAEFGQLLRRFHEATADFDHSAASGWCQDWADPAGGAVVCHNDLFPENVVFREGHVTALIDLAAAAPGRPLWDLAIAAQEWAPLHAPGWRLDHPDTLDGVRRTGLLARAYGLQSEQAQALVGVIAEERAHHLAHIRAEAEAGAEPWASYWVDTAGENRASADDAWLREQRSALTAAIGGA